MKRISFALLCLALCSCAVTHQVESFIPDSAVACKNPEFIVTAKKVSTNMGLDLTIYELTKDAQTTFGGDVSIQNVHWDLIGGKKTTVVYDVIRCNPDSTKR